MAYTTFGSPEHGGPGGGGLFVSVHAASTSIVAAPAGFPGSFAFQVSPVDGQAVTDFYGWLAGVGMPANLLAIPFVYRNSADFTASVSIAELSTPGNLVRRITQTDSEGVQLIDADEDVIAGTSGGYIVAGLVYRFLWLIDIRNPAGPGNQDALWVFRPAVNFVSAGVTFADDNPDTMGMAVAEAGQFIAGDEITVTGADEAGNNGTFTIASRAPGVITLAGDETLTNEGPTAVTLSTPARWDKAIDVPNWGDIGPTGVDKLFTFGTFIGKGLPGGGGPLQFTNPLVNALNVAPFNDALGSINTRYKPAIGDGQDMDFINGVDGGGGWGNPDRRNVNQIPADDLTTYDQADDAGDKQSYEIDTPSGADAPLAVHSYVRAGVIIGNTTGDIYIYDGNSDDQRGSVLTDANWADGGAMHADVNGVFFTDLNDAGKIALFNSLEIGLEDTDVGAIRLTAAGIPYFVEGALGLPPDFPSFVIPEFPSWQEPTPGGLPYPAKKEVVGY